jgi:hypothetical protein
MSFDGSFPRFSDRYFVKARLETSGTQTVFSHKFRARLPVCLPSRSCDPTQRVKWNAAKLGDEWQSI